MQIYKKTLYFICIALCQLLPHISYAGTGSMQVSATVESSCKAQVTALNFGQYDHSGDLLGTMTISVSCTAGTPYSIGLYQANTAAGSAGRVLRSTSATVHDTKHVLFYQIYKDPSRTQLLGNAIGQNTISGVGNGQLQQITLYATIPSGQEATAGSYQDTFDLMLNF